MFRWNPVPKAPLSLPLSGSFPSSSDNGETSLLHDPVLVLGVMRGIDAELHDVYRHDLVYSRTAQWKKSLPRELDDSVLLHILNFTKGEDLLNLCEVYMGSVCVDDSVLFDEEGDIQEAVLERLQQQRFRAIVVSDDCISEEPIGLFIRQQYESNKTNVVVMAIRGTFNLGYLRPFGVSWQMLAYTKRIVSLTESGHRVLGEYAFPFASKYCKSHFVVGDGRELFAELVEEEEHDDDSTGPPAQPNPGSPVIVHCYEGRCISYFGFVNGLDVSYGAIILRLCHADQFL